jgi:hypothetical protein
MLRGLMGGLTMPKGTVTVTDPVGRTVFVNGNYTPDFPDTIPATFVVDYGENIFETRTSSGRIDYSRTVVIDDDAPTCSIKLKRVKSGT